MIPMPRTGVLCAHTASTKSACLPMACTFLQSLDILLCSAGVRNAYLSLRAAARAKKKTNGKTYDISPLYVFHFGPFSWHELHEGSVWLTSRCWQVTMSAPYRSNNTCMHVQCTILYIAYKAF